MKCMSANNVPVMAYIRKETDQILSGAISLNTSMNIAVRF